MSQKTLEKKNLIPCTSFLSQLCGLMFSKKKNLLFVFRKEKRVTIHTWFVFFPIDLIFFDEKKKIIETKMDMKPFSMYRTRKKVKYLMEKSLRLCPGRCMRGF